MAVVVAVSIVAGVSVVAGVSAVAVVLVVLAVLEDSLFKKEKNGWFEKKWLCMIWCRAFLFLFIILDSQEYIK